MNEAIKKIAALEDVILEVNVSEISGKGQFLGKVNLSRFNSEKFIPNGGPVTKKGVSVSALGTSYDEAYNNVLERAVELMGL
jgi:hypothetical protein